MVEGATLSISATGARARVNALEISTSLVTGAVCVYNTLRPALCEGVTKVVVHTITVIRGAFPFTHGIEATWRWRTWVVRSDWSCMGQLPDNLVTGMRTQISESTK